MFSQHQSIVLQMSEGVLPMEGELEVLKGTEMKYFELFPERSYKQGNTVRVVQEANNTIIMR